MCKTSPSFSNFLACLKRLHGEQKRDCFAPSVYLLLCRNLLEPNLSFMNVMYVPAPHDAHKVDEKNKNWYLRHIYWSYALSTGFKTNTFLGQKYGHMRNKNVTNITFLYGIDFIRFLMRADIPSIHMTLQFVWHNNLTTINAFVAMWVLFYSKFTSFPNNENL